MRARLFSRSGSGDITPLALLRLMVLVGVWLAGPGGGGLARAQESSPAVASVENAVYTARLRDLDLTAGEMKLDVVRRGTGTAWLDWSDVKIAINQLRWEHQPIWSGTTPEQRMVVATDRDSDQLQGHWSAHGRLIHQKTVFDLAFPAALNTRLVLQLPADLTMEASAGVLQSAAEPKDGLREWTLELGNLTFTVLKIGSPSHFEKVTSPRYEMETEYRARRDGVFVRSDLTMEGTLPEGAPLQLVIPERLEIQSVVIFSGSIQVGAALSFNRVEGSPQLVNIAMDRLNLEPRFTLRLRTFQPVHWGEPHLLPRISVVGALETRRNVVVRVEPPLQLQNVDAQGFLQTSLTSEESAGEVWRFEAREPDSRLNVLIDLPQPDIVAEINCLADARRQSGWAAAVLSMHVENGSLFNTSILLPDDWKLVSVAAGDVESRLASWTLDQRQLHITWQNPMTSTSHRQLRLFARTSSWKPQTPTRLQIPQFRLPGNVSVQYQMLLPTGMELQVIEGEGWRLSENTPIAPQLLRMREVTERISDSRDDLSTTLRSSGESRGGRTLVNLVPKSASTESLTGPGLSETTRTPEPASPKPEMSPPDDPPATDAALEVQLLTMAGPTNQHGCVHQADLRFDRPVQAQAMQLSLPAECKVSSVEIDGQFVTVFRKGDEIPLPAEISSIREIRLTYMTPAGTGWLYQTNTVPIPKTVLPVAGFQWTLDLPGDQQLSRIDLPGVMSGDESLGTAERQYFGPLTRRPSDRMFNPLSESDWNDLIETRRKRRAAEPVRRSLQFIAPTVENSACYITWNSELTRRYAWVALLGCLMIGAAARLFQILWLRQVALIWLVILFVAAALAPPAWTLILGGMFSGSLLSILIPRHWMQNHDFLSASRRSRRLTSEVVTATCLLVSTGLLWGQEKVPGTAPPAESTPVAVPSSGTPGVVGSARLAGLRPLYLIESAHYELLRLSPTPQVRATFKVLSPPDSSEIFVRLPLQDVVFSSATECLVNGQKQTLIPSVTGDAMVVSVRPMPPAPPEEAKPEEGEQIPAEDSKLLDWSRSEIQLDFAIRPAVVTANPMSAPGTTSAGDLGVSAFRASVPPVLDSTLALPKNFASLPMRRWGESVDRGDEGGLLELGGIGRIQSDQEVADVMDVKGASAITMLDVTPLRFKGQTRILPGPTGWPSQLPLTFPAGCVISSISGASVIDTVSAAPAPDATSLTLRLRTGSPAAPVTINFELPGKPLNPMELMIPAFPLWQKGDIPHSLGLTGPPTSTLTLVKTPGVVPLSPEEWPAEGDSGRGRPALAVMLNSPQQVQLNWTRLNPVRTASVSEQLVLNREGIEWSAKVQMSVSQIPTFRHQFRIDPSVRIESVTVQESTGGIERGVRYSRSANILSIFVPGGQLGQQTFQLTGRLPLAVDAWTPLPTIDALGASVTDSDLTITDRTGWNIELESAAGVAMDSPVRSTESTSTPGTSRTVGNFSRETGPRPARLRVVMPADATRADSVMLVQANEDSDWEVVTTFHLTAVESTLKKAVFRIPPELTGIRIRPSLFQYTSQTDASGTIVNVKIPERYSSSATITVAARLGPESRDRLLSGQEGGPGRTPFPMIEVLSAQKASQFLLVESTSAILPSPTASLRIDAAAFPAWAPREWGRGVQDLSLTCYQQTRKDLTFVERTSADQTTRPIVRLEETVLWPMDEGKLQGLTRLWLRSTGKSQIRILHGAETRIESAMTSHDDFIAVAAVADGTVLQLPEQPHITGVVIRWTRQNADGVVRLLDYNAETPPQRLVAFTSPENWKLDAGSAQVLEPAQVWLARWAGLLECLRDSSTPVPVDSLLLSNIRLCQKEAALAVSVPSIGSRTPQQEEFSRLSGIWNSMKSELEFSGTVDSAANEPVSNTFTNLLEHGQAGLRVEWLSVPAGDWSGKVHHSTPQPYSWGMMAGALFVILMIGLVVRFSSVLKSVRDVIAQRPAWSFMVLGFVWWLWLSPSAAGLLLILLAWIWSACQWLWSLRLKLWKHPSVS
ncbi:hypothetical protein SH661x_003597 [Planctomicrobium sp. SH661]|uniref:hypothetical protein n=1 Tax=Planctomicrobium sp. SH661 TaxID=3448124 RepID=UPI003F5B0B51